MQNDFPFELDHIAILSRVDAPEAGILEKIGLVRFGGVTQLAGLGLASTSFFFENDYLELLWAHDAELAQQKMAPLHLDLDARAHWQETFQSPFGLMLRRKPRRRDPIPFATKQLKAEWMPDETWIDFSADNSGEPYFGVLPENLTYPSYKHTILNRDHPLGVKQLTSVRVSVFDGAPLSPIARWLNESGIAQIETAAYANLEITFDNGARGEAINLRPELPVVLKY